MGRPLRIQIANGTYHVTMESAGDWPFFYDAEDYVRFLRIAGYVVERHLWRMHAYCLMTTHYHLVFTTPEPNIARGMHVLNGLYATTFNRRHRRKGHLKAARYGSKLIQDEAHALEVARYVPLNPVRAGICTAPERWLWSSYAATLGLRRRPRFLDDEWLLTLFSPEPAFARVAYWAHVEAALAEAA
jgi:REP element-mobilizing transposase RayT